MENSTENYFELDAGCVRVWLEQEAIHFKAGDKFGDPVELTLEQAQDFAHALLAMIENLKTNCSDFKVAVSSLKCTT